MLSEKMIKSFEDAGAKRWTKGAFDRLYINANVLGYNIEYYNTGNVAYAEAPDGEKISNSCAKRILGHKTYINIEDGSIHTECKEYGYEDALNSFVNRILN